MRIAALLVVLAVVLAGCGSSGSKKPVAAPAGSVAQVGKQTITVDDLNGMLASARSYYKTQKQTFPKQGTAAYTKVRNKAIEFLVQGDVFLQEADRLGVAVTDKKLDSTIAAMRKQNFAGSEKKLDAAIKKQGLTYDQFRAQERIQLAESALQAKIANGAKVSDSDARAYWSKHKSDYKTPASRSVRHILVAKKSLADSLYAKLKNGASFASLVKKYSTDTGSKATGGKLTDTKGSFVPQFEKVAFALKTNEISKPVHSQFGWHIIQALGPVKNTPAHVQPFSKVKSQIVTNLTQQQQGAAWQNYLAKVAKDFKGKVAYQTGYAPATTTTPTTPAPPTTTG